ncbi:MAG: ferritin family protein [Thermodesulfobacteriota bacterium]|nr:ferritin family protein [Thermodesulfobacteriota bacterium]
MGYNFSPDEIFEMAKQIEVNGAIFYRKAAKKVTGKKEQQFLKALAEMEDQHEQTFAAMQENLKKEKSENLMFDPEGEAVLYLKAMADTKIFFKKEEPGHKLNEILTAAIKAEQDSIVFYLGMKELVADAAGKQRIDNIIHEEMGHIQILSNKLSEIA